MGVWLEHYLVTQADTQAELISRMHQLLVAHTVLSLEKGAEPFEWLPRAPDRYWKMWDEIDAPPIHLLFEPPSTVPASVRVSELVLRPAA